MGREGRGGGGEGGEGRRGGGEGGRERRNGESNHQTSHSISAPFEVVREYAYMRSHGLIQWSDPDPNPDCSHCGLGWRVYAGRHIPPICLQPAEKDHWVNWCYCMVFVVQLPLVTALEVGCAKRMERIHFG